MHLEKVQKPEENHHQGAPQQADWSLVFKSLVIHCITKVGDIAEEEDDLNDGDDHLVITLPYLCDLVLNSAYTSHEYVSLAAIFVFVARPAPWFTPLPVIARLEI